MSLSYEHNGALSFTKYVLDLLTLVNLNYGMWPFLQVVVDFLSLLERKKRTEKRK